MIAERLLFGGLRKMGLTRILGLIPFFLSRRPNSRTNSDSDGYPRTYVTDGHPDTSTDRTANRYSCANCFQFYCLIFCHWRSSMLTRLRRRVFAAASPTY